MQPSVPQLVCSIEVRYSSDYCAHVSLTRVKVRTARRPVPTEDAVSHMARPPPVWARIPGDPDGVSAGRNTAACSESPILIGLDKLSTCCCMRPRPRFDPTQPKRSLMCIIYGLTKASSTMVEVQGCKSCNRRCIGPDCIGLGLFNWNNRVIFTHDLLDEYTSAFTSSETPFVAWITVVSRRYLSYCSAHPFVREDVF
jgi:hypothetical protein